MPYPKPTPSGELVCLIRPETEIHAIFTNKQAKRKRKIYFRVALKRTVVKIRKEISNLNYRTTELQTQTTDCNELILEPLLARFKSQIGDKTVWDVFGFHVSYTRDLFQAELNAPAPRTVSVCDRAKVTSLPPRE